MTTMLDAALDYAMRGWAVFPCLPGGKRPATAHGFKDATTDPAKIRAWWTANPNCNIGVATGAVSGIVVVDTDNPQAETWVSARSNSPTLKQQTAKGGHRFYLHPGASTTIRTATRLHGVAGLDIRGDGGYVVVAPSVHPSGTHYTWENNEPLATLPSWVLSVPGQPAPAPAVGTGSSTNNGAAAPGPVATQTATHAPSQSTPSSGNGSTFPQPDMVADAVRYLDMLAPFRKDNYDDWLRVGMALHELGDIGLSLWDIWSSKDKRGDPHPKYQPGGCAQRWQTFTRNPNAPNAIAFGSLVQWAKDDQAARRAQQAAPTPQGQAQSQPGGSPQTSAPGVAGTTPPQGAAGSASPQSGQQGQQAQAQQTQSQPGSASAQGQQQGQTQQTTTGSGGGSNSPPNPPGGGAQGAASSGQPAPTPIIHPCTDVGNALRFIDQYGDTVRFIPQLKTWRQFNGQRWVERDETEIAWLMQQTLEHIQQEALQAHAAGNTQARELGDWAKKSQRNAQFKRALDQAKPRLIQPAMSDENEPLWDADPMLLNVRNGTVDLRTGQRRDHRADDFITRLAPVMFDEHATCPNWESTLGIAYGGDQDVINYIGAWIGLCLTGLVNEHKLFLFSWGEGDSLKSTILEMVVALLGDYARSATDAILFRSKRGRTHHNELARLPGVRLLFRSEVSADAEWNEELLQQLTGKNTITAYPLYGAHFDFVPVSKLWVEGNYMPRARHESGPFWNRLRVVPHNHKPPGVIERYRETHLMPELPGILNWAIRHLLDYLKRGEHLPPTPAMVTTAITAARDDADDLQNYLDEYTVPDPQSNPLCSDVREEYAKYCKLYGIQITYGRNQLHRAFAQRGYPAVSGTGNQKVFKGLKIVRRF